MSNVDAFMKEQFIPFRKRVVDSLLEKYPDTFAGFNKYFLDNESYMGLQVTENGETVGEYTFVLDGIDISEVKYGVLSSKLNHPFGVIKPYGIVEKSVLENMLQDEQKFIDDPFSEKNKYMPHFTIKFMK